MPLNFANPEINSKPDDLNLKLLKEESNQFCIEEEEPDHHFRTEIPNFVLDMGLDPDVLCVYVQLKRIAGDKGACWKSLKELAKICCMGITRLRQAMQILADDFLFLQGKPCDPFCLIKIIKRFKEDGSPDTNLIKIVPIWRKNGDFYRAKMREGGTSRGEGGVLRAAREGTSRGEHKEEPMKKIPLKEITPPTPSDQKAAKAARVCFGSHVKLKQEEYDKLCVDNTKQVIDTLINEMNDYCQASKPKGYVDYAAALRQWIHRRKTQPQTLKAKYENPRDDIKKRQLEEYAKHNGSFDDNTLRF